MELASVVPSDLEWVSEVIDGWDCTLRWTLRGHTPSSRLLEALLWADVLVQLVARKSNQTPVALYQLTDADLYNGVAQLDLMVDPDSAEHLGGSGVEFVTRVFRDLPLRKVGVAAPADAPGVRACLGPSAQLVARLDSHLRRAATDYVDVDLYEIWSGR